MRCLKCILVYDTVFSWKDRLNLLLTAAVATVHFSPIHRFLRPGETTHIHRWSYQQQFLCKGPVLLETFLFWLSESVQDRAASWLRSASFLASSWHPRISVSPAPGPPPVLSSQGFPDRGLLDLFRDGTGNLLSFPDAAGFLRSTGSLPYLAQTSIFCIVL